MNNIEILEKVCKCRKFDGVFTTNEVIFEAIENLIQKNKELKEKYLLLNQINDIEKSQHRKSMKELLKDINNNYIPKSKVKAKIEEINKRIDYLDKELAEAYIQREKLGTETELDANEQYIYNMEQERSIRHTEKYAYLKFLEGE